MRLVEIHDKGRVVTLTMNRPDKRNALNHDLIAELKTALHELKDHAEVRVIILTGAGKTFSAGADLAALRGLQTAGLSENLADSQHLAELFSLIHHYPRPIIARVNGHAIAGGCGLVAACDFSVAVEGAKLGFTEVRIGFVPAIIMTFVVRKLGETYAREMLLRGHLIDAVEAEKRSLINRAVPREELDDVVHALASELATQTSASALALTKQLLAVQHSMPVASVLQHAVHVNAMARSTPDCQAGIAAFLNKTDPPWKA